MKKLFFSIMAVALAATMCVGVMSCGKDKEPEELDYSYSIKRKWLNIITDGGYDLRYGLEFKQDGTYSYVNPDISVEGNYRIFEQKDTTGVISTIWMGNVFEVEFVGRLFKMDVSGFSDFEQWWVYYSSKGGMSILIEAYSNNKYIQYFGGFSRPPF